MIKNSRIDIYNIPISKITSQYIGYINKAQELELDIAGEYIVMASTLMSIKSRMLLPMSKDDQSEDDDDPRTDLVAQLLTYQTFKDASSYLSELEDKRQQSFAKEESVPQSEIEIQLKPGSAVASDLTLTYISLLKRKKVNDTDSAVVEEESISIEDAADNVIGSLNKSKNKQSKFRSILKEQNSISELIVTFMAILELSKKQEIECYQESVNDDILIALKGE